MSGIASVKVFGRGRRSIDNDGERFTPITVDPATRLKHWHRYLLALDFVSEKTVLDVASGEGYGANLLASVAARVVGVDKDEAAVDHARRRYPRPNMRFEAAAATRLPRDWTATFDVVVSFETIEHMGLADQRLFIAEVKRVLKPSGVLILSTPNRGRRAQRGREASPHHIAELSARELRPLLQAHFTNVRLLSQNVHLTSLIWDGTKPGPTVTPLHLPAEAAAREPTLPIFEAANLVALCSNRPLAMMADSVAVDHHTAVPWRPASLLDILAPRLVRWRRTLAPDGTVRAGLWDALKGVAERLRRF